MIDPFLTCVHLQFSPFIRQKDLMFGKHVTLKGSMIGTKLSIHCKCIQCNFYTFYVCPTFHCNPTALFTFDYCSKWKNLNTDLQLFTFLHFYMYIVMCMANTCNFYTFIRLSQFPLYIFAVSSESKNKYIEIRRLLLQKIVDPIVEREEMSNEWEEALQIEHEWGTGISSLLHSNEEIEILHQTWHMAAVR